MSTEIRVVVQGLDYTLDEAKSEHLKRGIRARFAPRKSDQSEKARRGWRRWLRVELGLSRADRKRFGAELKAFRERTLPLLVCLTETERGPDGPQAYGIRMNLTDKRRLRLMRRGVHSTIQVARFRLGDQWVTHHHVHVLHRGSVGDAAADLFLRRLAERVRDARRAGDETLTTGDFNTGLGRVERVLGGIALGEGVSGIVYSAGLKADLEAIDDFGRRHGLTNHHGVVARLRLRRQQ